MPVASVNTSPNKKTQSLIVIAVVALLAIISAVLFIVLNQSQNPENKAAEPSINTIPTSKPVATLPANDVPPTGTGTTGTGQACQADGATCKWQSSGTTASSSAAGGSIPTSFNYEIRDATTGQIVKSGNTTALSVSFTPISGHAYTCTVTPINACSQGTPVVAKASCAPSITPTVTPTPTKAISSTPTPTPTGVLSPTPTPTGTRTPTPTISVTPSATPTGTLTPTKTPTPTEIIIVSATNTPSASTPTSGSGPSSTSAPTPPASGIIEPSIAILVFAGIVILLGLVF